MKSLGSKAYYKICDNSKKGFLDSPLREPAKAPLCKNAISLFRDFCLYDFLRFFGHVNTYICCFAIYAEEEKRKEKDGEEQMREI